MAISRGSLALRYGLVLVAILLFSVLPLVLAIGSSIVAESAGCQLDEGSTHPCIVMGSEVGETLSVFFIVGWLAMLTMPAGAAAMFIWTIVLIVHLLVRRSKRAV